MDDDYDPNVSGGGSRGSTSLPKFNHLYPILFFSHFIRFCGANKCGGPLSSPDGRIESIVTLEESRTGKRTRHINMRFHRVREAVAKDSIDVTRVMGGNDPATSQMVADILTKSTPAPLFAAMASIMSGMRR